MKTFICAAIAAVATADLDEKLEAIVNTASSESVTLMASTAEGALPKMEASFMTMEIVEKLNPDQRKSPEETTKYLMVDFKTTLAASSVSAQQIVVASAKITDNSEVACTVVVPAEPTEGVADDPSVANWNMETDISTADAATIADGYLAHGPWVSGGGSSAASDAYKKAFALKKDADGNWVAHCQAVRLIGDIPARVYTGSSLRYGWGEVPDFKNVSDEATVSVQVQVYDASDASLT